MDYSVGMIQIKDILDIWIVLDCQIKNVYTLVNAKLSPMQSITVIVKLLITSNTFNGNTHFDDFSDQGNYWNQQPLSYYFDEMIKLVYKV